MEEQHEKNLREMMSSQLCSKDFKCYKSGFKNLCKAKDIGLKAFIECLEYQEQCEFSMEFGYSYFFCRCPIRVYIAKALGK